MCRHISTKRQIMECWTSIVDDFQELVTFSWSIRVSFDRRLLQAFSKRFVIWPIACRKV